MNTAIIIFMISAILGIMILLGIYYTLKKYRQYTKWRTGRKGEKKVAAMLHSVSKNPSNQFHVLHNVYLPLYEKTTQIDHIVIGKFGVIVVETKHMGGNVYGSLEQKNWAKVTGRGSMTFYNPMMQNKTHIDCLLHILRKANLYNVRVDSLVVFSHKHVSLHIPKGMPVITISLLKKYLKKWRYKKDNGVDVQRVAQVIMNSMISDPKRIKAHTGNVKEMVHAQKGD